MTVTIGHIEFYLLLLVRVSAFIVSAPFFSLTNIPRKVKAAIAAFLALVLFQTVPYEPAVYGGAADFAAVVVKEAAVGLLLGFVMNICTYILNFAGNLIDTEIGLSMVNSLDPVSHTQTTITGNYYTYFVLLILFVTNLHHFIISAIADSFRIVPVGQAVFRPGSYVILVKFISEYFIIGFRIMLPVFAAILLVNIVLGILAKVAPQMNMFVIGIQLKILIGFVILFFITGMLPFVADFISEEMKLMADSLIKALAP